MPLRVCSVQSGAVPDSKYQRNSTGDLDMVPLNNYLTTMTTAGGRPIVDDGIATAPVLQQHSPKTVHRPLLTKIKENEK